MAKATAPKRIKPPDEEHICEAGLEIALIELTQSAADIVELIAELAMKTLAGKRRKLQVRTWRELPES